MAKEVYETVLGNGLKIIGEFSSHAKSSALGFFVKTGARDETLKESGISHFLEHMMFKGTDKRSALQVTYDMGNIGAQANAYTSEEHTVYYAGVLPEYLSNMHELLADMLRPALDNDEFNTEKKVILEEIALYQDRPHFYLADNATHDYFDGHPAGNSVLGTIESVSAIERDHMQEYFNRRYAPSNMALVISGSFNWDEFVANSEKYCGGWGDFKTARELPEFSFKPISKVYKKKELNQSHVLLVAPAASLHDETRYPLGLLAVILGDSTGSKLYWSLVASGIAESASADVDERDGVGTFSLFASTEPDRLELVTKKLYEAITDPLEFTEQDLERAKSKILSRIVMNGELPMGRLMSLGTEWLARARIHSLAVVMDRIRSISKSEIEEALKFYPLNQWSEFKLIPER